MSSTVLIVDDDRELCDLLLEFLQLEDFTASAVHNGREAISLCRNQNFDAIVLDIMLPGLQGLEVLRELRTFCTTPVLMLTARGEDTDRIVGLELGADDYLAKPCNPRELAARLRAVLRRAGPATGVVGTTELAVGDTRLNTAERSASHAGTPLSLTTSEFNILQLLLQQAGTVVAKEALSQQALGRALTAYDRSVDVHISKLRKKLAASCGNNLIISVRGSGYQITVKAQSNPL